MIRQMKKKVNFENRTVHQLWNSSIMTILSISADFISPVSLAMERMINASMNSIEMSAYFVMDN